jgi:hypothetical protein
MNHHQRRAAALKAAIRDAPLFAPPPLDLPLVQITLAKEGIPDKVLTLSALELRDYFAVCRLEHAYRQPIADETFEKLARALQTELTQKLRCEIYAIIMGTALMITRGWHSPRAMLQLLKKLKLDAFQALTDAQSQSDSWAEFVIRTIQHQANQLQLPVGSVIDRQIEAIREVVPRGRPGEEARSLFFESVVATAQQYDERLALPPREDSRGMTSTPLFEFGAAMCDLVADYGNFMLEQQQLPLGRFNGFSTLSREQLIYHLEVARRVILQEKSISSVNS